MTSWVGLHTGQQACLLPSSCTPDWPHLKQFPSGAPLGPGGLSELGCDLGTLELGALPMGLPAAAPEVAAVPREVAWTPAGRPAGVIVGAGFYQCRARSVNLKDLTCSNMHPVQATLRQAGKPSL